MGIKRGSILVLVIVAAWFAPVSLVAAGEWVSLPSLAKLEVSILENQRRLDDPELGLGEDFYTRPEEDLNVWRSQAEFGKWKLRRDIALRTLLRGDPLTFREELQELVVGVDVSDDNHAPSLAELLHLAVESGTSSNLDLELYSRVVKDLEPLFGRSIDRHQGALYLASYHFSVGNRARLSTIATTEAKATGADAQFAAGYATLQLARLDQSCAVAQRSMGLLGEAKNEYEKQSSAMDVGRVALHVTEAFLLCAKLDTPSARASWIEKALISAEEARQNLDPLECPLFWGTAYQTSARVFELAADLQTSNEEKERLKYLGDRANTLGLSPP